MGLIKVLFAARHGNTVLNQKNAFRGSMNPDLAPEGIVDAELLADYFEPIDLSAIFYSDRKRSTQTAEIIAARKPDVECYPTKSLWAWDVGMFSGEEKNKENVAKLEYYVQNPDVPIPDGEALNGFKSRVRPCIKEGLEIADRCGAPVLFVVHSSVIHELGAMLNGSHKAALVKPGGITTVYADIENNCFTAKPDFKEDLQTERETRRADTIS